MTRVRSLGTEKLLKYDVVAMLFDDNLTLFWPEKSKLIRELEDIPMPDHYSYHQKPESAFLTDIMAAVRKVPPTRLRKISDFKVHTNDQGVYHRRDYIFDTTTHPCWRDSSHFVPIA
ncbi:Uncharacterised protein at_DN2125 [Pycnogonum litorale]